jgi:HSP20 family protein
MQTRFNPFELHTGVAVTPLLRDFDQLFRELANAPRREQGVRGFVPAADVYETEGGLTLKVDLPGHDPQAIQVKVEKDVLTIHSERKPEQESESAKARRLERGFGVYERSFVLPQSVDTAKVEARYDNGVLTLHVPRREEAKPRVIEVKVQQ